MKKLWVLLILTAMIGVTYADDSSSSVYKSTDSNGNPSFSDKPSAGATPVQIAPVQSFSMPATSTNTTSTQPAVAVNYQSLTITSPPLDTYPSGQTPSGPQGATIWDNNGAVTVEVAVNPNLQPGDTLQLLVNGVVAQQSQSGTTFNLTGLDSDQYTIMAQIVDSGGAIKISSDPLTVFLRHHLVNQAPSNNAVRQGAQQIIQNHPGATGQVQQAVQQNRNN